MPTASALAPSASFVSPEGSSEAPAAKSQFAISMKLTKAKFVILATRPVGPVRILLTTPVCDATWGPCYSNHNVLENVLQGLWKLGGRGFVFLVLRIAKLAIIWRVFVNPVF